MKYLITLLSLLFSVNLSNVLAKEPPELNKTIKTVKKNLKVYIQNPNGLKGTFELNPSDLTVKNLYIQVHRHFGPGKIILFGKPLREFESMTDSLIRGLVSDPGLHFSPEK